MPRPFRQRATHDTPDDKPGEAADGLSVEHLPGIGMRCGLTDVEGRPVTVVRHTDGRCEIYLTAPDQVVIELASSTAAAIADVLTGQVTTAPRVRERFGHALGGLLIDSRTVQPGSEADGKSIEDLAIRKRTGVSVIAVLRGDLPIVAPDAKQELAAGDELVVAARPGDLPLLEDLLRGATAAT